MYIENGQIKYTDDDMHNVAKRIAELKAELELERKKVQVLAKWLHDERSSTFRPPTNQPHVEGIIEQATAKAKESK